MIVVAVLSLALASALAGLLAAAVARRAAAQRIDAAVAELTGTAAPGPDRPPRPALDRSLDDLERVVDEQVRARREAAATERRLAWALGALQSGVVIFDDRGEVVYSNDPGASFLAPRNTDALVNEARALSDSFSPLMTRLQDLRTAMASNMSATSLSAIRPHLSATREEITRVNGKIGEFRTKLDAFATRWSAKR